MWAVSNAILPPMETNNVYNLMHQLTQESKSLWRIKNNYLDESASNEEKDFWMELEQDKEAHVEKLKELIKKALS
jgi:hypothetical protein